MLAPGLKTGMANLVLQTPPGWRFSVLRDGGRRLLLGVPRGAVSHGNFASNLGGGVKIRLVGPLRIRIDYRVFRLAGSPLVDTYHRFYAGANIKF